jgi:Predicted membrane protein
MNNDMIHPTPDTENEIPAKETAAEEAAAISTPDTAEAASDCQPPAVETPESPAVSEIPSAEETTTASVPDEPVAPVPEKFAVAPEEPVKAAEEPVAPVPEKSAVAPEEPVKAAAQQPYQQPYQQPFQQPVQQPIQQPIQPPVQPQSTPGVTQQYYQYTPVNPALLVQQNTADGFAVASLICSIVGLVSCCTVLPSFLALIFGAISKAKNDGTRPTGMSTAGLVLGIIGILVNLLVLLGMFYME